MKPMATKGAKRKAASKARAQFSSDPKYESLLVITRFHFILFWPGTKWLFC